MEHDEIRDIYTEMLPEVRPAPSSDTPYRYLCAFLPEDKDAAILDAGCGNGQYALRLAQDGYSAIEAVDLFEEIDTKGSFHYQRSSVEQLPFGDESFAFAYSFSVVFYLDDPRDAFREYLRVLKPGGTVVISTHTKHSLHTWDRKIRKRVGGARHLEGVKFLSSDRYAAMLRESGFEVLNRWGYGLSYPRGNPLARMRRKAVAKSNPGPLHSALHRPALLQALVSNIAYHSLIAARKPGCDEDAV